MAIVAFVLTIPVGARTLVLGRRMFRLMTRRFAKLADIPDDYRVGVGTDRLHGDRLLAQSEPADVGH